MATATCTGTRTNSPTPTLPTTATLTPTATPTNTGAAGTPTATCTGTPTNSPTGTPTSTPSATPSATLTGLDIYSAGAPTTIVAGTYQYSYVHIHTGGILEAAAGGPISILVSQYFAVDSGATFIGDGTGESTSGTPSNTSASAGAGHGGAGGSDGLGNAGGSTYDSLTAPTLPGSMGAFRNCGNDYGAYGGGFLYVGVAGGPATLNGWISEDGSSSFVCSGAPSGAGSGGAIFIQAGTIVGTGVLWANGGNGLADSSGGGDNAGGGGGGIIVLSTQTANNFTGTYSVSGGTAVSPAQPGQAGAFNQTTY